jgi:spermidine synthase
MASMARRRSQPRPGSQSRVRLATRAGPVPPPGSLAVRVGRDAGRAALLVDGVVQSISPADGAADGGYWAAMLPPARPRTALILGYGGGTIARLLVDRWGQGLDIVGVDDDPGVLGAARDVGWLSDGQLGRVELADAFDYVKRCQRRFDYIALDLYRADQFVGRALHKPFLRRLRALLEPRGWLAVNLFVDRLSARRAERLGQVFTIRDRVTVGGNVILRAQP